MNAQPLKKLPKDPVFTVTTPAKAPKAPRAKKGPVTGVVEQVREAVKPKNRLATTLGFLLGGIVPMASYVLAHHEISLDRPIYAQLPSYLVLGGLAYSAKTVYDWGKRAFTSGFKALGFVVLLEGVMVAASSGWLSVMALCYLIAINGVATGCNLSVRSEA